MILVIMNRDGQMHIFAYRQVDGNYRTVCEKTIARTSRMNTISSDNSFSGLCDACKKQFDLAYYFNLEYNINILRNKNQLQYYTLRKYHQHEMLGPTESYSYLERKNNWPKLARLKKTLRKVKKYE